MRVSAPSDVLSAVASALDEALASPMLTPRATPLAARHRGIDVDNIGAGVGHGVGVDAARGGNAQVLRWPVHAYRSGVSDHIGSCQRAAAGHAGAPC